MGDVPDLSERRAASRMGESPYGNVPQASRAPVTLQIIGADSPESPWALVDTNGHTYALGMGGDSRHAVLHLTILAAMAVKELPPEKVKAAMRTAEATRADLHY